jgi:nitroreductase
MRNQMAKDILTIIKERRTIRKYQDKPIPKEIIDKIIEAGIWGPSVPSFLQIQPWKFIVVTRKDKIEKIGKIVLQKAQKSEISVRIMLNTAANIIKGARALIIIYNSKDLDKLKDKFKTIYSKFDKIIKTAQLSAISAAIQNMILTAEAQGLGSCWLDTPLFCRKELQKFLNSKEDLAAVLTLGYPAEEGRRSLRKPFSETVEYIG